MFVAPDSYGSGIGLGTTPAATTGFVGDALQATVSGLPEPAPVDPARQQQDYQQRLQNIAEIAARLAVATKIHYDPKLGENNAKVEDMVAQERQALMEVGQNNGWAEPPQPKVQEINPATDKGSPSQLALAFAQTIQRNPTALTYFAALPPQELATHYSDTLRTNAADLPAPPPEVSEPSAIDTAVVSITRRPNASLHLTAGLAPKPNADFFDRMSGKKPTSDADKA